MGDFLPSLRMKNIFDPSTQGQDFTTPDIDFGANQPYDMTGPDAPFDVAKRMSQVYHPETGATDYFNNLTQNMPESQRPSLLRTLAASLSAFGPGGHQVGQQVMDWPNEERMKDWKAQLGPAYQAASLERQNNVNERTLAYQQVSAELRARADEERAKKNDRDANIRQQRADIYGWKAQHPNKKFIFPKGGNVLMMDPMTGERVDTGVPTGTLTETDKMHLSQTQALERIDQQHENAVDLEGVRQGNREINIGLTNEWGRYRDQHKPGRGAAGTKAETPAARRTRLYNAAQEVINTNPELGKFITIEPGGRFRIESPGKPNFFGFDNGPTQDQFDDINEKIYGYRPSDESKTESAPPPNGRAGSGMNPGNHPADDAVTYWNEDGTQYFPNSESGGGSQAQPPSSGNTSSNTSSRTSPPNEEMVRVINPQGQPKKIRRSQLQQALASGYRMAQ